MNVLHISAECYPFVKIGGLADVVGSLPGEIKKIRNAEVRVMLPKYKSIPHKYIQKMTHLVHFSINVGSKSNVYVGIETLKLGNIIYYFIDNQFYFGSRDHVYGYGDESERFAYFQKATLAAIQNIDFLPNVIHVHDWHTSMIPLLLKKTFPQYSNIRTLLSIHNLAYQGVFHIDDYRYFNIPYDSRFEFDGMLNFLKAGIVSSDYLSTVSKTYAKEIMTPYFGCGMQNLLKQRKDRLIGILNGISYSDFSPETDKFIPYKYSISNVKEGKKENKKALFSKLGVDFDLTKPVIGLISRLVGQKGLDLIKHVFDEMLDRDDFIFVVLGDGEKEYVDFFHQLQSKYPKKMKATFGYSNELAHLIYSASDMFLMPSRFEPCGLGQIIALKYGTIPVVRETGGLSDTVEAYNEFLHTGNGFSFTNYNAHDMMHVIRYALNIFHEFKSEWDGLIQRAMTSDFSWKISAKTYKKLYTKMLKE
ncbi:MAG: glycogen synthase [Firmicutes bacterium]|nr:glycogen synthase [Bacillota bacterium]